MPVRETGFCRDSPDWPPRQRLRLTLDFQERRRELPLQNLSHPQFFATDCRANPLLIVGEGHGGGRALANVA